MEKPLRKWEGVSLGWKNLGSRNPHMWGGRWRMGRKRQSGVWKKQAIWEAHCGDHCYKGKYGKYATYLR